MTRELDTPLAIALGVVEPARARYMDVIHVTPRPDEVHSTCNCKGAYVHQVPL